MLFYVLSPQICQTCGHLATPLVCHPVSVGVHKRRDVVLCAATTAGKIQNFVSLDFLQIRTGENASTQKC